MRFGPRHQDWTIGALTGETDLYCLRFCSYTEKERLKINNHFDNEKNEKLQVGFLPVNCEAQFSSPSVPSAAMTKTQKVQFVPGVSAEICAAFTLTVLFW